MSRGERDGYLSLAFGDFFFSFFLFSSSFFRLVTANVSASVVINLPPFETITTANDLLYF